MPTTTPEGNIVFPKASWELYMAVREDVADTKQVTFVHGRLEIMASPHSIKHEWEKTFIGRLLEAYCLLRGIDIEGSGGLTLRHKELRVGCEPDESYYVKTRLPRPEGTSVYRPHPLPAAGPGHRSRPDQPHAEQGARLRRAGRGGDLALGGRTAERPPAPR